MRWRLLLLVLVVVLLLLPAAPPAPAQDLATLEPDAALIAHGLNGAGSLTGAGWRVAEVYGHRLWVDVLEPTETWGLGVSADLSPGRAACLGCGYWRGWLGYVGVHVGF
jgi:hypothetical protein